MEVDTLSHRLFTPVPHLTYPSPSQGFSNELAVGLFPSSSSQQAVFLPVTKLCRPITFLALGLKYSLINLQVGLVHVTLDHTQCTQGRSGWALKNTIEICRQQALLQNSSDCYVLTCRQQALLQNSSDCYVLTCRQQALLQNSSDCYVLTSRQQASSP